MAVPKTKLLIFAKHPTPGEVMTRLCPPLTPEQAAAVQRACIRLLCERAFRSWPVRPVLVISPDDAGPAFRRIVGPYIPIITQGDGDLGARLTRASKAAMQDNAPQVLIIGSDSPTLPARMLTEARKQLKKSDVVIGPCEDGGFYLIGLKRVDDNMLSNIDWSSDQVTSQTKERVAGCGMTVAMLEPWYDLDRPADLRRAVQDIRAADGRDDLELLGVLEEVLAAAYERKAVAQT